eukprot:scaffold123810_cov51-Phaeocystis_antarctica.AAC.1
MTLAQARALSLTSTSRGLRTVRTGYACQPPAYCTHQRRKARYAYQPRACVPYVPTLAPQALTLTLTLALALILALALTLSLAPSSTSTPKPKPNQALPRSCAPAYDVRAAIDVLGRGTYSQLRVGLG